MSRPGSGKQRRALIDEAIRFWLDNRDKGDLVRQYEQGYRYHPESMDEIRAMEQLSADAFGEEG